MNDRTLESYFADWESEVFGFGYGTGEPHTLEALKHFFAAVGNELGPYSYNYETLEAAVGPPVAWLLISAMGHANVIEYGTSPRYGWLTDPGKKLKDFLASKSVDELVDICCAECGENPGCSSDYCNCGPEGYEKGRVCPNPFFYRRKY